MARSNRVRVKEARLNAAEFENALVEFAKSPPDLVDEAEFRRRLRETTLTRYKRATGLLDEVESTLQKVAKQTRPQPSTRDLNLAIKKVDQAIVQMTHASLKFNKGAVSEGIRDILVIPRTKAGKSRRRKR